MSEYQTLILAAVQAAYGLNGRRVVEDAFARAERTERVEAELAEALQQRDAARALGSDVYRWAVLIRREDAEKAAKLFAAARTAGWSASRYAVTCGDGLDASEAYRWAVLAAHHYNEARALLGLSERTDA